MKNAAQFLGRFLLDRRRGTPRILEVRDHLDGVYLVTDGDAGLLMTSEALSDRIGDIFLTRERAERALRQVMMSFGGRAKDDKPACRTEPALHGLINEMGARAPLEPVTPNVPGKLVSQTHARNDPAFVNLVSSVLGLPTEHIRILHAIAGRKAHAIHRFTEGLLGGHELAAINLIDAQAAAEVDYPVLVEAIVAMRKASLLEVVQDALPAGRPELARFWIVVNPDCIAVLASGLTPIGLVA